MDKTEYDALLEIFTKSQQHLSNVLCEVRTAIQKMGLMYNVINPNIMVDKYKKDSFRDWIIFREYVNQLEYMTEVFDIIYENIQV